MKSRPFVLTAAALITAIILTSSRPARAQPYKVYGVSDLVRVFGDGYNPPPLFDRCSVFGIRGEVVSAQVAIRTAAALEDITVELTPLRNSGNGKMLAEDPPEWNFVGHVHVEANAENQPDHYIVRKAPAEFPDYLMEERSVRMDPNTWKSVWLTIRIPPDAVPGNYLGSVKIRTDRGSRSMPLRLRVYPLDMPGERHLDVTEWASYSHMEKYHGISEEYSDEWFDMLRVYAENMVSHRQNVFQVPMSAIRISRNRRGELEFDFALFDRLSEVFWSTGKMDYLETGHIGRFGEEGWADTAIVLKDFPGVRDHGGEEVTLRGEEVLPFLLPAFQDHLRQKGWLDKTLFHVRDEPSLHNALAWERTSRYVNELAPGLKRIDAIETDFILKEEMIEIAVPKLDAFRSWYPSFREWVEEGHTLWFYTVGIFQGAQLPNKTIDVPLMNNRILHWLNYKYDATGFLHWGWNQWFTESPFTDVSRHVGDGWHVYPKRDGLLNSLRWEQMRNGIQDYEYFWLLEQRVRTLKDSLGKDFGWIIPSHRGKEIASKVVRNFKDHAGDPEVLYSVKKELIGEILDLDTSPRMYIQTNPQEGTSWTMHSSVAVLGWAEPGTAITINGEEIPVRENGMFMEQFGGDHIDPNKIPWENNLKIKAVKGQDEKEIVRTYYIDF